MTRGCGRRMRRGPCACSSGMAGTARAEDAVFRPHFVPANYVPKIGHRINPRLMAQALAGPVRIMKGQFDLVLSSWIYPDSCAVAEIAREQGFRFAAIAQGS